MQTFSRSWHLRALALGLLIAMVEASPAEAGVPDSSAASPSPGQARSAQPLADVRSPATAFALSAAATLAPILIAGSEGSSAQAAGYAACGILIGPAAGYFYGGCGRRGVSGIAVRSGLVVAGLAVAFASVDQQSDFPGGLQWVVTGAVAATCVALYDIGMVAEHVERRNLRIQGARVGPAVRFAADGTPWLGVTVSTGH
jgi:hypothetical protein